ncbi:MAG: asparaginase domain-containing protein [Phycisphaerales bacterium]
MRQITLISTGGTIEKTYDEHAGTLTNRSSVVQEMLRLLRLEDTQINTLQLMQKDSLDLTDTDRSRILDAVRLIIGPPTPQDQAPVYDPSNCQGIVILHGTDTLCQTGDWLYNALMDTDMPLHIPVILTGAMRPFEMKRSDALQNLNEAIFAASLLAPGVYVVAHGKALPFPGPTKDRERGTFVLTNIER